MVDERVVVVGAGVVGLSTAFFLRRHGYEVVLLDAGECGSGASRGNAGWITPSLSSPVAAPGVMLQAMRWMGRRSSPLALRPQPQIDFLRWAAEFARSCTPGRFAAGIAATARFAAHATAAYDELVSAGVQFERHDAGLLMAFDRPASLEHYLHELEGLAPYGCRPVVVDADRAREREPALGRVGAGVLYVDQDAHVRPETLTDGLRQWLAGAGVTIREHEPVLGFTMARDRVSAVTTARATIPGDVVVLATGAWLQQLARQLNVRIPVVAGKGYSIDATDGFPALRTPLYLADRRIAITPVDGRLRLAGTMELSGLNDKIALHRVAGIVQGAREALVGWSDTTRFDAPWSGMRPMTPDTLPVIGPLAPWRNVHVAGGHAMLGVTLGPITGKVLAQSIVEKDVPDLLRPFDPGRFRRRRSAPTR